GVADEDPALLEEVTWLVESPYPVLCSFDEEFLELPAEVLLTTMKKHQRYFPVLDGNGKPLAAFIAVNNTDTRDPKVVINGHERVLRARLADARFFYAEDRKKSLGAMADELQQVVFQAKLGTSYEKVKRFQALAVTMAKASVGPEIVSHVERASVLCKADLVSEMVGEFPELQGIMGREYARLAGEPDEVCQAIFEHYLPRSAGDILPSSDIGAMVSLADKLDTITGCFGIGLVPTGTADPYALRRQCLGIINIILDKKYTVSLADAVNAALGLLAEKLSRPAAEVAADVLGFFSGRLANQLTSQGYSHDVVESVLSLGVDDLNDIVSRIEALHRMKQDPDFEALAVSFKRVVNILAGMEPGKVDPAVFAQDEERGLHDKLLEIRDQVKDKMSAKEYLDALKIIAAI
ncbi:MAG: glycine--tRNA ligase subunit beta, partial [Oceanisphaera sp.]|nr:glycine--tRNA ligase subunit beta [Oceanisphaera sp.]